MMQKSRGHELSTRFGKNEEDAWEDEEGRLLQLQHSALR